MPFSDPIRRQKKRHKRERTAETAQTLTEPRLVTHADPALRQMDQQLRGSDPLEVFILCEHQRKRVAEIENLQSLPPLRHSVRSVFVVPWELHSCCLQKNCSCPDPNRSRETLLILTVFFPDFIVS